MAVCFVNIPFGKKPDLAGGVLIDFDSIYELATSISTPYLPGP
jgi:hypothetical protein